MKRIFLEDIVKYQDLSSVITLGVNRNSKDDKGVMSIKLAPNEKEDKVKKESIKKFLNENLWITSDLHLNHKNRNSSNFIIEMINEINSKVKITDCILFCGDLAKKDNTDEEQRNCIQSFLNKLNCKNIILILGNHDILPIRDYYEMGFNFVSDKLICNINNIDVIFTHMPIDPTGYDLNIHGHIHGTKEYWNMPWQKHIDVYIGLNDNKIWQFKDYIEFYKEGRYKGKSVKKDLN